MTALIGGEPVQYEGSVHFNDKPLATALWKLAAYLGGATVIVVWLNSETWQLGLALFAATFGTMATIFALISRRRIRISASYVQIRRALRSRLLSRSDIALVVHLPRLLVPGTSGYISLLGHDGSRLWGSQTAMWPPEAIAQLQRAGLAFHCEQTATTPESVNERWPHALAWQYAHPRKAMITAGAATLVLVFAAGAAIALLT